MMRSMLIIATLVLTGCNSATETSHPVQNLTVGTAQCAKFSWGTSQMAECLDRAAESQSATAQGSSAEVNG
jgi:uncharacterized lipoprotein YmbA